MALFSINSETVVFFHHLLDTFPFNVRGQNYRHGVELYYTGFCLAVMFLTEGARKRRKLCPPCLPQSFASDVYPVCIPRYLGCV